MMTVFAKAIMSKVKDNYSRGTQVISTLRHLFQVTKENKHFSSMKV